MVLYGIVRLNKPAKGPLVMKSFEYITSPSEFARTNLFYAFIGGCDSTSSTFYFDRNHYPAYELLWITKGKGWFRHGDTWIGLTKGDCLLHNMRFPHAYRAEPDDPFQMMYLVFDGIDLEAMWARLFPSAVVMLPTCPSDGRIEPLLRTIFDWMRNDLPRNELILSSLIYELLLQISDLSNRNKYSYSGVMMPESIKQAHLYMDKHFITITQVADVAREVNLSLYHFIRQFKRYYGCTPKEYILLKRINHAKRQLILTDEPVAQIANLSGFDSYNTFLHSFHKIEHCSPSTYRQSWKKTPKK